jgi:cyclopropane fatty-acyl-phospholipid synthase-like methyltransferase
MSALDDVRSYYDANTERFERYGQGGAVLHRAVWAPDVKNRSEAFRTIDRMVLGELEALDDLPDEGVHVLDLGCGVGSSLVFLASKLRIRATGATLSSVQADRASERARSAGVAERVHFVAANYLDLPPVLAPAHFAYSIEAFIHGPDPAAYFVAAARSLAPGGVLVVCDDFLTKEARTAGTSRTRRLLDEVREGWLANTLVSTEAANELAERAGFVRVKDIDLTPHLELGRPRDRIISLLVTLGRRLPLRGPAWRSFVGGNALQRALREGLLEYRFVVWRLDGARQELDRAAE